VIELTPPEVEWAEWAIAPMAEYWQEQHDDDASPIPDALPRLDGAALWLPDNRAVVADFLYRLECQACDMACDEARDTGTGLAALQRPIRSLARKIRARFPLCC